MEAEDLLRLAEQLVAGFVPKENLLEPLLQWALELDPELDRASLLLAELYIGLDRHEDARKVLAEVEPEDDLEMLNAVALAQAGSFDHAGAARTLARALELDPSDPTLYANRGLALYLGADYELAALDLVRSLVVVSKVYMGMSGKRKLLPVGSTTLLGDLRPFLGKGRQALRKQAGGDPFPFVLMDAWAKLVEDKPQAARRILAKLTARDRDHWAATALGSVATKAIVEDWRDRSERVAVRRALERAPEELALLVRLSELAERPEKDALFEAIVARVPLWAKAYENASQTREWLHDLDGALAWANRGLEALPETWSLLDRRAKVHEKRRDFRAALRDLDQLVDETGAEEPDEDDAAEVAQWVNGLLAARARVRFRLRDLDGARNDFDLACEHTRESAQIGPLRERARFLAVVGDRKAAIQDLDRVLEEKILSDIRDVARRARLREKIGDHAGAAEDYARLQEWKDEVARANKPRPKPKGRAKRGKK